MHRLPNFDESARQMTHSHFGRLQPCPVKAPITSLRGRIDNEIISRLGIAHAIRNPVEVLLERGPMVGPQFRKRNPAARQILLVAKILIRKEQQVETSPLRSIEKFPVFPALPAEFRYGGDFMPRQSASNLHRDRLVQKDLHASSRSIEERLQEVIKRKSVRQILEECLDWDSGAGEHRAPSQDRRIAGRVSICGKVGLEVN
jgi:hypothetical protein